MNNHTSLVAWMKLLGFSALGLFLFFVPITIGTKTTIAFDHLASYLVKEQYTLSVFCCLA